LTNIAVNGLFDTKRCESNTVYRNIAFTCFIYLNFGYDSFCLHLYFTR